MKITIDDKACRKHGLSMEEALMALSIRAGDPRDTLGTIVAKEIVVKKDNVLLVTQGGSDKLDEVLAESGGCMMSEEELKELAKKMMDAYPHGAMVDRKTGKLTTYYFQCNNAEVRAKLKSFFARYGEYPEEELLDAEKRYVARWNGNYQQVGFRQLKYFIFKKDKETGEISSPLLDFLENKESEEEMVGVNTDNWRHKIV